MTTYINSIQSFSITISASTSGTATISAISGTGFLIYGGFTCSNAGQDAATDEPRLSWSGTTVTATLNTSGTCTIYGCIVDATSNLVTGVQAGTITISSGTSNTATITSVSTTLSAVFYLGATSTTTSQSPLNTGIDTRVTLTNATTVTANLNSVGNTTVSYVVVTFAAGAVNSNVQQFSTTKSTLTSNTQAVTSVTAANSIIAWGGCTSTANNAGTNVPWITLTNGTTVTLTSNVTAGYTCNFTVIEFVAGVLAQTSQYGSITMTSQTSNTASITSASTTGTFCAYLGQTNSVGGSINDNKVLSGVNQTSATVVTAHVDTSSTNSITVGFEAITFTAAPTGGPSPFYDRKQMYGGMEAMSGGVI